MIEQLNDSWSAPYQVDSSADVVRSVGAELVKWSSLETKSEILELVDDYTTRSSDLSWKLSEFQGMVLGTTHAIYWELIYLQQGLDRDLKTLSDRNRFVPASAQLAAYYVSRSIKDRFFEHIEKTMSEVQIISAAAISRRKAFDELKAILADIKGHAVKDQNIAIESQKQLQKGLMGIWTKFGGNAGNFKRLESNLDIVERIKADNGKAQKHVKGAEMVLRQAYTDLSRLQGDLKRAQSMNHQRLRQDLEAVRGDIERIAANLLDMRNSAEEKRKNLDAEAYVEGNHHFAGEMEKLETIG